MGSEAAGWSPRPRRKRCKVSASWALWLKWKPRPRARARYALPPPRLPRGARAFELLLRSSAEDILSLWRVSSRAEVSVFFIGVSAKYILCCFTSRGLFIYLSCRCVRPLARCIGRMLVGVVTSVGSRLSCSCVDFGMSVGVALCLAGTWAFFSEVFGLNFNVR